MFNSNCLPTPCRSSVDRVALMLVLACCGVSISRADEASDIASAKSLSRAFRAVSKRILPTVVKIKTTIRPRTSRTEPTSPGNNPPPDSPFESFFGDQAPGFTPPDAPARSELGSGVIIDAQGIILTNEHVVEGADEVLVELSDGKQFHAIDVKGDEQSDLAVLRIKADHSLPAATLGDSDKVEIGDWVLAIGHPFDLDFTVSSGIISGKARVLPSGRRADFLQTDAAINPGNSGGPLVNLDGEVVGINTAIASNSGGCQGIGFAIPANLAKWVTRQLIEKGSVQRAYLGVRIEEIRAERAKELGIDPGEGVLVAEVFPDTPAAKAVLNNNDRILKFAGHDVHSPRQLQEFVEQAELGTSPAAQIVRDGKPLTVLVVASPLPKTFGLAGTILQDPKLAGGSTVSELGIKIADLTKADIERFRYTGFKGALVKQVEPDGLAAQAGIRAGMLIIQVEKKSVRSAAEFTTAMKDRSLSKGVMLLIRTPDGGNRLVHLRK